MTPDRWHQVKELMAAALAVSPGERPSFVEERAGTDEELRREVFSLLESHDDAGEFLEEPAIEGHTTDTAPEAVQPDMAGTRVGAWEIVREIGRGGMGTVYLGVRADKEFDKRVAIKLIRGGMESEFAIRRFRNERQILARLEHPNIARLLDGGTTPQGFPYFVMEYVEGEPLLAHCRSRSLGIRERLAIFLQICSAVHYAHRRMIIHRDLKPGNVLVKGDGTPKLLDFGIAKILDPDRADPHGDATQAGFRLVTPAYASPEQIRSEPATACSDQYSLAVVLWELVTGERSRYSNGERAFDLPESGPDDTTRILVRNLREVVRKASREDPLQRYTSVEDLAADVERVMAGEMVAHEPATERLTAPAEAPQQGSLAVLPFELLGNDTTSETYLGVGITDALITRLSNVGRISVRPTGAVLKFANRADAVEAGRELNVEYVLEGRVQKVSGRVRVTVQLVEVGTRTPVWAERFDEEFEDLLKVEDSISAQVAQALIPQLTGEERTELARPGTASVKAHQCYLRGRWYWNQHTEEALPQALVLFTEAVTEDPGYGRAHAGIADYHIALGMRGILPPVESFSAAIQAARTAIELDPKLGEAHASLGLALWVRDGDIETASHHFQLAIALNPDYAPAHDWCGLMNSAAGNPQMAVASIDRARKLEPQNGVFAADLAMAHYSARRYEQATNILTGGRPGDEEPADPPQVVNGSILPLSLLACGRRTQALSAARRFVKLTGRNPMALGVLAHVEAATGNGTEARELLEELTNRSRDYYVPGTALALASMACGRADDAIRFLERARREGDWWTMYLSLMPVWDGLRGHGKFQRLLKHKPAVVHAEPRAGWSAWLRRPAFWICAAALLALTLALFYPRLFPARPRFQNARIARLSTSGVAERAVISPDGKFVAYTTRVEGQVSLWLRRLEDAATRRVAGPYGDLIPSLQFTRNGTHLAFVTRPVNDPLEGGLHIVPVSGGPITDALQGVGNPVGVSPDESHFAYFRTNAQSGLDELVVVVAATRAERVLERRPRPESYTVTPGPVWSPDGTRIICAVRGPLRNGYGIRLHTVDLNGEARSLGGPVWQDIQGITWLEGSDGLLVAGQDLDGTFYQLWHVPLGAGSATRVTNDLSNYNSVGTDAGARTIAAARSQIIANLYIAQPGDIAHAREITPGGGRYFDVAWTVSGRMLYASDDTGTAEIWSMDSAGGGQHQLTRGLGRNYGPAPSPDGRAIAFHSNHGGVWNLWVMDSDGSNPTQITHDQSDSNWPQFTPDGASVVYHHIGQNALQTIWRASLAGGKPTQVTTQLSMYPTVAPDGRMAAWLCEDPADPKWQLAVYAPGATKPYRRIDFPGNRMPNVTLRWVPNADAISYIESREGVSNIWIQPIAGGPPRRLTSFTTGRIYSFDWAQDGRLVYSRGMTTSDVVLLHEAENR